MTLREQITNDMAAFFNTNEFAEAATYNSAAVTVVLANEEASREFGDSGRKLRRTAELVVQRSQVSSPANGDTVVLNGESWCVIDVIRKDDWTATLSIERVETIERAAPGHRIR